MICLEKMLNFDDFTSLNFFYFLIVKKHQFSRFFEKMLKFRVLIIRNGNSTTADIVCFFVDFGRKRNVKIRYSVLFLSILEENETPKQIRFEPQSLVKAVYFGYNVKRSDIAS